MLYLRVYNALVNRIFCQDLKKGDRLPSIQKIAETYGVAYNTAREAVQLLYENGFISKKERTPCKILFDVKSTDTQKFVAQLALQSKEYILDVYRSRAFIFPSFAPICASLISEQEIDHIAESPLLYFSEFGAPYIGRMRRFTHQFISSLHNSLLDYLLDRTEISMDLPFVLLEQDEKNMDNLCSNIYETHHIICRSIRDHQFDNLQPAYESLYHSAINAITDTLRRLSPSSTISANTDISLTIYQPENFSLDYLYHQIIYQIIQFINNNHYKKGDFLPSESDLCNLFGASKQPVRHALQILDEMKILQTINGKGTQVIIGEEEYCDKEFIREIMLTRTNDILEALYLLCIPSKVIALYAIKHTKLRSVLKNELSHLQIFEFRLYFSMIWEHIFNSLRSNILSNLYSLINQRIVSIIFFKQFLPNQLQQNYFCQEISAAVESDNDEAFADLIHKMTVTVCKMTLEAFQNIGIEIESRKLLLFQI